MRHTAWDEERGLVGTCAHQGDFLHGDPGAVFLFTAHGADSRGSVIFLVAHYLPGPLLDFPGPVFLSVSTVTWAGRKFARVSYNCVKGSRKRAAGKRVSTSRLLPVGPSPL